MFRSYMTLNPLSDLRQVSELLDRVFDSNPARQEVGTPETFTLPLDIFEHDEKVFIKAAVPGIDPSDLEVTIEEGVLTIRGETSQKDYRDDTRIHRREYRYGAFSRSVRLPDNLNTRAVEAVFKNGMVTVSMPRIAPARPQTLRVPIRGAIDAVQPQEAAEDKPTVAED